MWSSPDKPGSSSLIRNGLVRALVSQYRWLLLNFYYNNRFVYYNNSYFESLPDRRWINMNLLPKLAKLGNEKVLYVGCAPYTWKWLQVFPKSVDLFTVDYKRRNAIW